MSSADRVHHLRLTLAVGAALAFLTLLLPGTEAVSAEAPGLTSQAAADSARQLEFRAEWGLSTDPMFMASVADDPANYANPFRVPLSRSELVDLFARPDSYVLRKLIAFASDHSDVLGGIYVDQSTGGTVVINATPAAGPVAAEASALVPAGGKVLVRPVDRSESLLQDVVDRISAQLPWLNGNGVDVVETYPDVVSNRVVLRLEQVTEPAISLLTSKFGGDLDIQEGTQADPTSCTKTSCPPPWRGGIRISVSSGACTSGFIARDVSGAGQKFMISAGHCAGMGTTVKQNGTTVGTVVANKFQGTTNEDALLVQIDPSKKSEEPSLLPRRRSNSRIAWRSRTESCLVAEAGGSAGWG